MLYDRPEGCNKRRGQRRCRPTRGRPNPHPPLADYAISTPPTFQRQPNYFPPLFHSIAFSSIFFLHFVFFFLRFGFALLLLNFFWRFLGYIFTSFLHFHDDAASAEGASSWEAAKIAVVCVCAKRHKWVKPGPMSERPIEGERQRAKQFGAACMPLPAPTCHFPLPTLGYPGSGCTEIGK